MSPFTEDIDRDLVSRHATAQFSNSLADDPSIAPFLAAGAGHAAAMDRLFADPNNVGLFGQFGGVFFHKLCPGYYEAHTKVLPQGRGVWAVQMMRSAMLWMATRTDALEVVTKCPHGNLRAMALARVVGCEYEWTTRPLFPLNGKIVPCDMYVMRLHLWVKQEHAFLARCGERFHQWLVGQGVPADHISDETHDAYVGAAMEMILGGQPVKGLWFYGKWAVVSGYQQAVMVSDDPLIIDIGTARLALEAGEWRICRA